MPDEDPWARLTYSTFNEDQVHEELEYEAAFGMAAHDPNYAVLHAGHYWIYPTLPLEEHQLETAAVDLAFAIWDAHHSSTSQLLSRPEHNPPQRSVRVTRYRNGQPIETSPTTTGLPISPHSSEQRASTTVTPIERPSLHEHPQPHLRQELDSKRTQKQH